MLDHPLPIALFLVGLGLLATGVFLNAWWTLAGGVMSLTACAWLVTEYRR